MAEQCWHDYDTPGALEGRAPKCIKCGETISIQVAWGWNAALSLARPVMEEMVGELRELRQWVYRDRLSVCKGGWSCDCCDAAGHCRDDGSPNKLECKPDCVLRLLKERIDSVLQKWEQIK